jgi:hypothetical protein
MPGSGVYPHQVDIADRHGAGDHVDVDLCFPIQDRRDDRGDLTSVARPHEGEMPPSKTPTATTAPDCAHRRRSRGPSYMSWDVAAAPLGNSNADSWAAGLPHYHRRITDGFGNRVEGGSMKWHWPWENGP